MQNLERFIRDKLWNLDTQEESRNETSHATSFGINKCLEKIFRKNIHIINKKYTISTEKEVEEYCSEVADIIKLDQGILAKPVVTLISFKSGDKIGVNFLTESHWQMLVILPFNDNYWKVYFKDSCFESQTLSSELKNKLIGLCMNIDFIDEEFKNVIQAKNYHDCGWWCLFNACMWILAGRDDFYNKFDYKKEILGSKLRAIFYSKGLILEEESKEAEFIHEDKRNTCFNTKLYIGTVNFRKLLLESDYIVDKSLFIYDVLNSGIKVMVITRPRRWGKSLNLNMLKTFLEIEQDTESLNEKRKLFEVEYIKSQKLNLSNWMNWRLQNLKIHNYMRIVLEAIQLFF